MPTKQDMSALSKEAIAFWLSLWDEASGGFRFAPSQPATLMATAYSILGLEFTQGLIQLTGSQRQAITHFLMAAVQPDGSFLDPLFRVEDVLSAEHDLAYFQEETTTFCQQALDALGAPPPPPRTYADGRNTAAGVIQFCEALNWQNPWLDSNPVMFALSQLCHDAERHHKPDLLAAVDAALDWLDAHQSPKTGLWQGPHEVSLTAAMAATFHFTFFYGYRGRPIQYPERIIDSCLQLQKDHGLFCGDRIGQTCLDYDAIDLISKARLLTDYRHEEVEAALWHAHKALLSLHNSDGGFADCKAQLQWSNSRKARLLRKVGLGQLAPSFVHVPVTGTYNVCWNLLTCETSESNAFSTWFRLLALRLSVQPNWPAKAAEDAFTFRELPFLGYHNPCSWSML